MSITKESENNNENKVFLMRLKLREKGIEWFDFREQYWMFLRGY